MGKRFLTYEEFWPFYLKEHSKLWTKRLHVYGTLLALLTAIWLGARGHYAYIPLCLLVGYGLSWIGHFFVEKNRPATFQYPLWSFVSDFRMAYLFLAGKLK